MISGFFVINKPSGVTSHDVVNRVRRILGTRKVGHTGTLDPFATGVLPVAVNDGTKAIPFLDEKHKQYDAELQLGIVTDSHDLTGNVIRCCSETDVSPERFEACLERFQGDIDQVPPMYSAIKQAGTPLYRLARQGIEVERQSRKVAIHGIEILRYEPPFVSIRVSCSRGTYIRVLAHDIGEMLGCGASLRNLHRLASGPFHVSGALTLAQLEDVVTTGLVDGFCMTPSAALSHLPEVVLTDTDRVKVLNGQALAWSEMEMVGASPGCETGLIRLTRDGKLVAVAVFEQTEQGRARLKPKRVFV